MYHTTISRLLAAKRFFAAHPDGLLRTGDWTKETWNKAKFDAWFRACMNNKISNDTRTWRKLSASYQSDLRRDARTINDYTGKRIRNTGCRNILATPEMQRRYPHINTHPRED